MGIFPYLCGFSSPGPVTEPHVTSPPSTASEWGGLSLEEAFRNATATVERKCLVEALRRKGGNRAKAARLLGVDRKTLHSDLRDYGINLETEVE